MLILLHPFDNILLEGVNVRENNKKNIYNGEIPFRGQQIQLYSLAKKNPFLPPSSGYSSI